MLAVQRLLSVLLVSLLLAACGSRQEPPKPPPVEQTVFRDDVAAMQKAREVENKVMEQKAAADSAIEQAESAH
jgi:uncharacterized protein YcfL